MASGSCSRRSITCRTNPRVCAPTTNGCFCEILRDADQPSPATNVDLAGETVDCVWPDRRRVVEIDSDTATPYHATLRTTKLP